MSIWFKKELHCENLNEMSKDTLGEWLGIRFLEIGENYLKASMPVDHRTLQPFGYLHGGASAAMAETMGSVGAVLVVDPVQFLVLGVEINANHIRAVREGTVFGTALPLHIGGSSHVWEIKMTDDREKLICISRLTVFIKRRSRSTTMPGPEPPCLKHLNNVRIGIVQHFLHSGFPDPFQRRNVFAFFRYQRLG